MIEQILEDGFMDYKKVQQRMKAAGYSRKQIKEEKLRFGVETLTIKNGEETGWLWYIPKNVWNRHFAGK